MQPANLTIVYIVRLNAELISFNLTIYIARLNAELISFNVTIYTVRIADLI